MPKEPEQLGDRLRAIEERLLVVEQDNLVVHGVWEHVTLPVLGTLAASPLHRAALERMVSQAAEWVEQVAGEDAHRYARYVALLRSYLLDPNGPDLSI
jgi:hypothetical protein